MLTGSWDKESKFSYTQSELADFGADLLSEYMENPGFCHEIIEELYSFGVAILYRFSSTNEPVISNERFNHPSTPTIPSKHKPE